MKSPSLKILYATSLFAVTVSLAGAPSLIGVERAEREAFLARMANIFPFPGVIKEQNEMNDTINRSFPVGQGGTLKVRSSIGTVEVQAVETRDVNIELRRKIKAADRQGADDILRNLQLDFIHQDNDVNVLVKLPEEWDWEKIKRVRLDFKITIPRTYNLSVNTVGVIRTTDIQGNVDLSSSGFILTTGNVRGDAYLSSSGGPITTGDIDGVATVSSAGGSVVIGDVQNNASLSSGGGKIRIGNIGGELGVRSSGGSITIGRVGGEIVANSSGGYIHIAEVTKTIEAVSLGGEVKTYISQNPQSDCSFITSGGSVNLRLGETVAVTIDAETGPGSVLTSYSLFKGRESSGSVLKGDINGGGPKIIIRTAAGHLTLRRSDEPVGDRKH